MDEKNKGQKNYQDLTSLDNLAGNSSDDDYNDSYADNYSDPYDQMGETDYSSPSDAGGFSDNAKNIADSTKNKLKNLENGVKKGGKLTGKKDLASKESLSASQKLLPTKSKNPLNVKAQIKKKVIIWAITLATGGVAGVGFGSVFGGATMLQAMSAKFANGVINFQQHIMTNFSFRVYKGMLGGKKTCTGATCKFHSMSERQVKKLNKHGFKLLDDAGKEIKPGGGRVRPSKIQVPDDLVEKGVPKHLSAGNIIDNMNNHAALRKSMRHAYHPRFAGLNDKVFMKTLSKLKVSKKLRPFKKGATAEERDKAFIDEANGKAGSEGSKPEYKIDNDKKALVDQDGREVKYLPNGEKVDPNDLDGALKQWEDVSKNSEALMDEAKKSNKKAINSAASDLKGGFFNSLKGWLTTVSDISQYLCGIFNAVRALDLAIKTARSAQAVKVFFMVAPVADSIKAGKAEPEQVADIAGRLNQTLKNSKGQLVQGTAGDSAGMHFVMQNSREPYTDSLDKYIGSGYLGFWGTIVDGVMHGFSIAPEGFVADSCLFLRSFAFQAVDFIFSTGSMFVPGFQAVKGAATAGKLAIKEAFQDGFAAAMKKLMSKEMLIKAGTKAGGAAKKAGTAFIERLKAPGLRFKTQFELMKDGFGPKLSRKMALDKYPKSNAVRFGAMMGANFEFERAIQQIPKTLADITNGKIADDETVGEELGDAIAVGGDKLMQSSCQEGSCAPIPPEKAVAYARETRKTQLAYAEEERVDSAWYDVSNPYTALGSVAGDLAIHYGGTDSLGQFISKTMALVNKSFNGLLSPAKSYADDKTAYQCGDSTYEKVNVGCDYLGMPTYGLTETYDMDYTVDTMHKYNYIDDEGEVVPGSRYEKFLNACVENDQIPIGTKDLEDVKWDPTAGDRGKNCVQDQFFDGEDVNLFYNYGVYKRVLDGMEEESSESESGGTGDPLDGDALAKSFEDATHGTGDYDGAYGRQCADLSKWFLVTKTKMFPSAPLCHGYQCAGVCADGSKGKISVSKEPTAPAIFSDPPGCLGSSTEYGHTGIVVKVSPDGSIETRETGAVWGRVVKKTYTKAQYSSCMKFCNIPKDLMK